MTSSKRPSSNVQAALHEAGGSPPARDRRDGILVLGKVQAILEAFAGDMASAGPSEVAARIGANKSTTFRVLGSMERAGLLDRRPDGTFGLGLWLMELGSLVQSRLDLRRAAGPSLEELGRATGQTVFLSVLHGHQATCIDRLAGSNVDVLALRLGGTLPLYCGAGPRVLLAALPDAEVERYLEAAPFPALTPATLTSAAELRADVARTRESGYVVSMEDVTVGVGALGAPIRDAAGGAIAAISVAGLKHEFTGAAEARAMALVIAAARSVSSSLGAPRRSTG
ncbi:MAG TPA: IclR family transcriptional regulator [Candidatus Limnocylindrales bacterium]|jgi:DNA-binding IclR family transcriptional regulator